MFTGQVTNLKPNCEFSWGSSTQLCPGRFPMHGALVGCWCQVTYKVSGCRAPTSQCSFTLFFFLKKLHHQSILFCLCGEREREREREREPAKSVQQRAADKHPGLLSWTENFRSFKCGASLGFSWKQRSRSGS